MIDWPERLNHSILGMGVVDAWVLDNGFSSNDLMAQRDFYNSLAEQLRDNRADYQSRRDRGLIDFEERTWRDDGTSRSGIHANLTTV